jgi:hypothetical protein
VYFKIRNILPKSGTFLLGHPVYTGCNRTNKNFTVPEHPLYSPDLAPCDFYFFPKIKSVLKGTHFVSVQNVKAKTVEILNKLTEHDLQNCFEHWQHRMQLCVNSVGNYFEGHHS